MRLLQAMASVVPNGDSRLARALHARRGLLETYAQWSARERDPSRPLVWVHAPSVGEALQAQPVLRALRAHRPDVQIAYTFFSPSAEPFAAAIPADFRAFLPFDHPRDSTAAIAALRPSAIVFCKADVWPNLVATADTSGVQLGVISATVPETSMRLRNPALALMRSTFARLDRVGAIDEADAGRLVRMGVREERVSVTGDTRFDQVWERAARTPPGIVRKLTTQRPTLVAGSTWPSDEEVLFPAIAAVRKAHPELRTIVAPHEVTPSRLAGLEQSLRSAGLSSGRLSETESASAESVAAGSGPDVMIVDSYGLLGDLYRLASIAFVGGGFHRAGLHSVLEPAAFGAPVIFGPQHGTSRDAKLLLGAGGAHTVSRRAEVETVLRRWLAAPAEREAAGAAARALVERNLGAAERSYEVIAGLLELSGIARPR